MQKKKNEIYIGKNGLGYCVNYNGQGVGESISTYRWPEKSSFYDVLNLLVNTADKFYSNGIKLKFDNHPDIKPISKDEKRTIEDFIKKLEKICIKNKKMDKFLKKVEKDSSQITYENQ